MYKTFFHLSVQIVDWLAGSERRFVRPV